MCECVVFKVSVCVCEKESVRRRHWGKETVGGGHNVLAFSPRRLDTRRMTVVMKQ